MTPYEKATQAVEQAEWDCEAEEARAIGHKRGGETKRKEKQCSKQS